MFCCLDEFNGHSRSQDDHNDLGDESFPLFEDEKLGPSQIFDSFEISSLNMKVNSPPFFHKSVDDSGDDDKSSKYHYPSEASIWMASLDESDIPESAVNDKDDAKSDLFEDSTQAKLKYLKGKSVRRGSEFHIQAPSGDEVYSMSHAILPVPNSQTFEWQNADGGDVMPHNNLSSSSGSSAYRLPLEKELFGGISAVNSLNHHAPESSTQPHETNFYFPLSFGGSTNPPSLEDSLELGDAAGDRDDIMSDSTFGTGYDASISDLFSNRGADPLTDKDLPLAHSRSASETHQRGTVASKEVLAASERRRKYHAKHRCSLCPQTFTARHNLSSESPTLQIFVALSLMSVFQTILTLISVTKPTHAVFVGVRSVLRVLLIGIAKLVKGLKTKALLKFSQQSKQLEDNSIIEFGDSATWRRQARWHVQVAGQPLLSALL